MYNYVLIYFLSLAILFASESPRSSVVRTGSGFIDYTKSPNTFKYFEAGMQ